MTQVTVRRVEDDWVARAKAEAAERGVSMNTVLLEALKKVFGEQDEKWTNGLEKLAGTMPPDPEFDEAMKLFDQIDEELWK